MSKQTFKVLLWSILSFLIGIQDSYSQNIEIIDATQEPFTPESIIRNYFIGEGVEILNISFEGTNESAGYFTNGTQDLGLSQGIVLGTGKVDRFINSYSVESSTLTSDETVRNQELIDIVGTETIKDIASYEITFIPSADSIQFNYVFASEEYPEYVCSQFNDVFGFFISGPNPSGGQYDAQNIALVPGTNLPVSINNVNNGVIGSSGSQANCPNIGTADLSEFYKDNFSENLIFDGILSPFIAAAKVTPCETYTIKFSVGDVNDFLKDSAVFLEGKSFSSNSIKIKALTTNANGTITEGCEEASVTFELPNISSENREINFQVLGNAENGVDYEAIPSTIMIPAGQITSSIEIVPIQDELEEGIENLGIVIDNGACISDTIWLGIEDNKLIPPAEQGPIYLCDDLPDAVDFTIPFVAPEPIVFRNQDEIRIEPTFQPVFSEIQVSNIFPSKLNQTDFIKVCIDELTHPWIEDLSIYLYGPDNQFIELTSKNGGNGGNGTQPDFMLNTCFTLNASQLINDPSLEPPYIGDFLPEGDWDDLFSRNSYDANGTWRLMLIDDFQGSVGELRSWSIYFGRSYDINYSWSPTDGISCTDCPDPSFDPNQSQTYNLEIEDSNGCTLNYEVPVLSDDTQVPNPIVRCGNSNFDTITFEWDEISEAISYQISIDNGPWEDIANQLSYTITDVLPSTQVSISVQAIGGCGNSEISEATCSTEICELEVELLSITEPDCAVPNSGSVTLLATNGLEPYTYTLQGIENNDGTFLNLTGGNYTASVMDSKNCVREFDFSVSSKDAIEIEIEVQNITCGESVGSVELIVSGGTGELDYNWSDNYNGDNDALPAGNYSLTVTDQVGCSSEESFLIEEEANISAEFEVIHPRCQGNNSGSISVVLEDPMLIDNIAWSNGENGSYLENLRVGVYEAMITDNEGCISTFTIELIEQIQLETEAKIVNNGCFGESLGSIELSVTGGEAPYAITWSNNSEGELLDQLAAGMYEATITDLSGCELIESIEIQQPVALEISELLIIEPSCINQNGGLIVYPEGGQAPYTARLNEGVFNEQLEFNNLSQGDYRVELMDSNGCLFKSQEVVQIEEVEDIVLEVASNIRLELGDSISLFATATNRNNIVDYFWSGGDTNLLSCTECQTPTFRGLNSTSFTVTAIDETGCEATENIFVFVEKNVDVFVPNAFSPNGDGINDYLTVFANAYLIASIDNFSVYDLWGNEVYKSSDLKVNDMNQGWNGFYKGDQLQQDVFVWNLQVTFIDGQTEQYSGDVSIIR